MTRRILAMAASLAVAVAMVTAAMALDEPPAPQKTAQPQPKPAAAKKPATVAKKAMPAAPVAKKVVAPNEDAQALQYIHQFRPILRSEYHRLVAACHPEPGRRQQIARDGEKALREAARKYQGMFQRVLTFKQRLALDPRRQIREGLLRSVEARLSDEMADRYRAELDRAEARYRSLAIRNLVARLDEELVLTREQREKIEAALTKRWDDSWSQSIEMLANGNRQFFPYMPDEIVVLHLNDDQKTVWWGIQKIPNMAWVGAMIMGGMPFVPAVEDPLEDPELKVARLEASKDDPKPAANQPAGGMMIGQVQVEVKAPARGVLKKEAVKKEAVKKPAAPEPSRKSP